MQIFKAKVFYFIILITTVSCTSTAEVFFQDVVDTSDKEIKFQEKKIFSFDNNLSTPSIVKKYINQLDFEERNNKLYALKHLTNLYKGTSLSKKWRKYLHTLINSDKPITDVNYFNNEENHGEKKINCSHS